MAREVAPGDPAVVSVGSFHAGTQNNIIPDEAKLQLTVRTYKPATRQLILNSIQRIAKAESLAAGAPKEPLVTISTAAHSAYNDPELTRAIVAKLRTVLGPDKLVEVPPQMAFDDFAEYGLAGAREVMFSLGAVYLDESAAAQRSGAAPLPGLHSPLWAGVQPRTAAPPHICPDRPRPART